MSKKENVIILGKVPPPYMGPSIATEIILNSTLNEQYNLIHADTKINSNLNDMGSISVTKIIKNIKLYINLFVLILKYKPKLVLIPISQTTVGFIKDSIYIIIAKLLRVKILINLRGSDFKAFYNKSNYINKFFIRTILSFCDSVIVLGNNLKYIFKDFFKDEQIHVVPNGANYDIPQKKKNKVPSILYLANLQSSKGIEDVIVALSLLKQRGYDFQANIVGSWREEKTKNFCLDLVRNENLPIKFHSNKSGREKFNFFSNADIFVFTPRKPEGHPWVIVEALASGLPIISTDQGAITESVIHEKNGFIVKTYSPEEIAERLIQLISNPKLMNEMAQKSKEYYNSYFTEEKMVENLSIAFNKTITMKKD